MTRRGRAAGFLALAVTAAALAAALAQRYGSSLAAGYGPLRPVVVTVAEIPAGETIGPREARSGLEVRRVPVRFVPPGTLRVPSAALGQEARVSLPAGSYVVASQLALPRPERPPGPRLGRGRRPVEIAVSGAEALFAGSAAPQGGSIDVVVTAEPRGPGPGRTYVAAAGVRLLALREASPSGPGPGGGWAATLALTRGQALELIEAESFARAIRLLPRPD